MPQENTIVECDFGYDMNDDMKDITQFTSVLNDKIQFCFLPVVQCPLIPTLSHGSFNTSDRHYNSFLHVQCDYGYFLEEFTDARVFSVPHLRKVMHTDCIIYLLDQSKSQSSHLYILANFCDKVRIEQNYQMPEHLSL